jgi:hypothetical protein
MSTHSANVVSVLVLCGGDAGDCTAGGDQSGPMVNGLADVIATRTDGRMSARITDRSGTTTEDAIAILDEVLHADPDLDLLVCGFREDMRANEPNIESALTQLIHRAKAHDVRVITLNASTLHPGDAVSCYRDAEDSPALAAHRIDLALIRLSMEEGISIIDVDRIIGEVGGDHHVHDICAYSPDARAAVRDELANVLEDYGFFDDRPLLQQQGREARA